MERYARAHAPLTFLIGTTLLCAACGSPGGADEETAEVAAPNPACTVPLGWWESRGLEPLFASDNAPEPTEDCQFHLWAWTAFVHFTQLDKDTGEPRFLSLKTPDDLKGSAPASGRLRLAPRDMKRSQPGEAERAGGVNQAETNGVLVDQRGRAVYYSTHMDDAYFDYARAHYGIAAFNGSDPDSVFPVGSTVLKVSWRQVEPGEDTSGFFTTRADVARLINEKDPSDPSKQTGQITPADGQWIENVEVALVGMHVVSVLVEHPEFAWATFELEGNAPNLPAGMAADSSKPVSAQSLTFYAAGTPAKDCNVNAEGRTDHVDEATQICTPITQVFRQFQYGGASPSRVLDIQQVNAEFQSALPIEAKSNSSLDPVFAAYSLVGTVWQNKDTLKPGLTGTEMCSTAVGSTSLMNSTMETFVQGAGQSCFLCHNTVAGGLPKGPQYIASNLALSHLLLDPFFEGE